MSLGGGDIREYIREYTRILVLQRNFIERIDLVHKYGPRILSTSSIDPKTLDRCLIVDLNNPKTFDQDFIGAHTQIEVFIGEPEDV
jgi:hypothetical protein